ncbi:MAG: plastocyanin/azurin family copper-binding protein [Cyanobacteria bacterium P01_F01_bin.143]
MTIIKGLFSTFVRRVILVAVIVICGCSIFATSETPEPAQDKTIELTGEEIVVTMGDSGELIYDPEELNVSVGDTVVWDNLSGSHNVVFNRVPDGIDAEAISEPTLATDPGPAHLVTFETPGTYTYYCTPHRELGMFGKVIVE